MKKDRFTLIELLVVIAIIAILLSILLPSLSRARESAIRAVCLSNLKQVGTATFGYCKNNNGQYPQTGYWMPTVVNQHNANFSSLPFHLRKYTNDQQGEVSNLLACPGFKKSLNGSTNPRGKFHFISEGFMIDAGMNYVSGYGINPKRTWGKPLHNIGAAYMTEVILPSKTYGLYELIGRFDANSNSLTAAPFHGYKNQTPVRNVMFMDGSVASKLWLPARPYQ